MPASYNPWITSPYDPRNKGRYARPLPYKYEQGQMYDPFRMGSLFGRKGIPGKTANWMANVQETSAHELGEEFSWLYGGRPLSRQEVQPLLSQAPRHDPRFGTIGGMPSIGQGPHAAGPGATAYRPIKGFGPTDPETGRAQFPYQEVGPTPAAMKDVGALAQLPYDLMDQYRRVANQGIYGPAGMNQIVSRGIQPQMERTKRTTTEALTHARAARQQTVQQGARMLAEKLGGKFASQPGLAMKLMGDQIIAPTLAKEMEMSMSLKVNEMNTLNALDGAIGDLLKANQESKMMGLAGVQDVMGFLQQRVANRWWDLSMENKFGWSPERTAAAGLTASQSLMALQQDYNLTNMQMDALWRDWMNEQQYQREEGGNPLGQERITSGGG